MSPSDVRSLDDRQIVEMLVSLKPADEAVAWLAAVISDDASFEGVRELRRRFARSTAEASVPTTKSGQHKNANTVAIDAERFRSFCYRRRLALTAVGPMFGRCAGWASVMCYKGHAGFYALDELALALDMRVEELIEAVATDEELRRVS